MIRVQREDFDVGAEIAGLARDNRSIGAVAAFVGLVRDIADGEAIRAMTLEHYPAMTEKMLAEVEAEAHRRWPLAASLVIHRYGELTPGERIVLVAVASAHRDAAFEACRFLIDWLKTKAPFWKLEERGGGAEWVGARDADDQAAAKWEAEREAKGEAKREAEREAKAEAKGEAERHKD